MPLDGTQRRASNGAIAMTLKDRIMLRDPGWQYSEVEAVVDPDDGSVLLHQEPDDSTGDIVVLSRDQWRQLAALLQREEDGQ